MGGGRRGRVWLTVDRVLRCKLSGLLSGLLARRVGVLPPRGFAFDVPPVHTSSRGSISPSSFLTAC
jgi:hypothetical protein